MQIIEASKGAQVPPQLPPQPLPEQFGYNPQQEVQSTEPQPQGASDDSTTPNTAGPA